MTRRLLYFLFFLTAYSGLAQSTKEIAQELGLGSPFSQGVSVVDINDDGYDDLFITRRNRDNQFFINNGDATFTNIAESAGVDDVGISALTIWTDFDKDGDMDFFLGMEEGESKLYQNNGDLTFTNVTAYTLGTVEGFVASAQWGDVNGDGWDDLFIFKLNGDNQYFFSDRKGGFDEVTTELGLVQKRLTMGAILFDFDRDNDLDLYMTHDGFGGNHFYVNDGVGNFDDRSEDLGIYTETDAMGLSIGDFNNDGWEDIYLTNLYENQLFKNLEGKGFEEVAKNAGVDDYGMGWGASWVDFDNDGWLDLYLANDSYFSDYSNVLFHNQRTETFSKSFVGEPIMSQKASYATAISDLNNDGVEELIITNRGSVDRLEIFEVEQNTENHWISLKLQAYDKRSMIGSIIKVEAGGQTYIQSLQSGTSWAGEDSDWMKFGIGDASNAAVSVYWTNGQSSRYDINQVDKFYTLSRDEFEIFPKESYSLSQDLITSIEYFELKNINTYIHRYINMNIYNNTKINIYKYDGMLMYSKSLSSIEKLDVSFLTRGVYILSLTDKGGTKRIKIFKD